MSSKKDRPAPLPVSSTTVWHIISNRGRPRAEAGFRKTERIAEARETCWSRLPRVGGSGGEESQRTAALVGSRTAGKAQAPSPSAAGSYRAQEARSLLGIEEAELAALIARFRLRQSWVEVYSKPEILALREIVAKRRRECLAGTANGRFSRLPNPPEVALTTSPPFREQVGVRASTLCQL